MALNVMIGSIITLIGSVFLFLGALGILRMPDLYNRMQAGTKTTTLGSILFLGGIATAHPDWAWKILILIIFILFTNPLSSNALARAAHFAGIPLTEKSVRDDLKDYSEPDEEDNDDEGGEQ